MAYTLTSVLESQKPVDTMVQASLLSPLILLFFLYIPPSLLLSFHVCCFHLPLGYFLSVEPQLYEGRDLTTNISLLQYNAWYVAQYWSKKKNPTQVYLTPTSLTFLGTIPQSLIIHQIRHRESSEFFEINQ